VAIEYSKTDNKCIDNIKKSGNNRPQENYNKSVKTFGKNS
jgi:hypothetical protein